VDVRFQHVRDAEVAGIFEHPIDVTLWIDRDRHLAVADQVAAIA
jgi:hypothetical protein